MNLQESIDDLRAKFGAFVSGGETKLAEAIARNAELTKQLESANAAIARAEMDLAAERTKMVALIAENTDIKAQFAAKDAKIAELEAKDQDLEKRAAEKARQTTTAQGIPAATLPQGTTSGETTEQKIESLQKQLNAEADPQKSYVIAKQINELRFGKK